MTKELVELLRDTEVTDYENFQMIPEDLTGLMQSLKFVYSEEDIDALSHWQLEEINDPNLVQWTLALKDHLESVSELEINSLESLLGAYIQTYGNRITVLVNKVKEIVERDKIDLDQQIIYAMNAVLEIIVGILGESNTCRTYEMLTSVVHSKLK